MKKLIVMILLFMALTSVYEASAQTRFGPQIGYVAKGDGAFFLGANAELGVNEKITIQPAFNYYFPSGFNGVSHSYWSLDADGHYHFTTDGSTSIYALLGLSYLHYTVADISDSKFGVNVGAGANFSTSSSLVPFVEIKYNSPWEGLVLSGGVRFGK